MPKYNATAAYTAAIPVETGDVIQNVGKQVILVCPGTAGNDDDAAEIPPGEGFTISAAEQVRVRCASRHGSTFKVIRGL